MKRATSALYRGDKNFRNDMTWLVHEYIERKRLAALGITTTTRELSAYKCDCFIVIDVELDRLREKDAEEDRKRAKGRR